MRVTLLRLLVLLLTAPSSLLLIQLGEARISGFHIDYELCSGQLSGTRSLHAAFRGARAHWLP